MDHIVGVADADKKGFMVSIENYYTLITERGGYSKLSREETADFLSKLKAAGETEKIQRYFVATLLHPYLCRSTGDRDALTEEEYSEYYYRAIAVREINNITHYFTAASLNAEGISAALLMKAEAYDAALMLAINSEELRATLGEKNYKAIIPTLDDMAKSIGENHNGTNYVVYKKKEGVYKVDAVMFTYDMQRIASVIADISKAVKTGAGAVEDTVEALGIDAYILPDAKALREEAKKKVEILRQNYISVANNALRQLKKKEVREAHDKHMEAGYIRRSVEGLKPYEEIEAEKESYLHNLVLYGNNTYFVIRKVDEYKKARNEKGLL